MIRATCLGHAALLVETDEARVLMDPILGSAVSGGGNVIDPPRTIDVSKLTALDLVVVSHHHSDHYNLNDLARIPNVHAQHFVIPNDARMHYTLTKWGVRKITALRSGESIQVKDLKLTATPSDVPFDEMGILFEQGETRLLNLVDTVFHPLLPDVAKIVGRAPNLILAPFQAGGYMSFLPLREGGLPPGLITTIEMWSKEYLEELTTDLAALQPQMVVAFADGLAYIDQGINARHFPMPDSAFVDRLQELNISACPAKPGLVLEVDGKSAWAARVPSDPSLIQVYHSQGADRTFDSNVPMTDRPLSWYELPHGGMGTTIDPDWFRLLENEMTVRLTRLNDSEDRGRMQQTLLDWHLELILPSEERLLLRVCWSGNGTGAWRKLKPDEGRGNYGILCHGPDLAQIALGRLDMEALTLGGLFRYRSPDEDSELERLRGRTLKPLEWIFGE